MKKIILLVPLMAMTCFTNCGAKQIDIWKIDLYKKSYQYNLDNIEQLASITEYEYNDKNLLTKSVETFQINIVSHSKTVCEYTYDDHEFYKTYSRIDYDEGSTISEHYSRYNSQYDDQGRMVHLITESKTEDSSWISIERSFKYADKVDTIETKDSEGTLISTTTITYDDHGWIINVKEERSAAKENAMDYGTETCLQLDEYGCAKEIIDYSLDSSYERSKKIAQDTITYLDNLYYRPVKELIVNYGPSGEVDSCNTVEREYDDKQRITLLKDYNGTDEATATEYYDYITYEY